MAVTRQNSTQVGRNKAVPPEMNSVSEDGGRVRIKAFDFAQSGAGDANSIAVLAKMPAGRVRVLRAYVKHSALGAARVATLGNGAYKNATNATVAEDVDAFSGNLDVAAAAGKTVEINAVVDSRAGWDFILQVTGGTIPDGATLNGYVEYVVD